MNPSTVKRFWLKVKKSENCWEWTASKRHKGYGAFVWCSNGEVIQGRAHRFSWILHHGAIPDGLCVLHKCDNPRCVRPNHLFLGTKADNNRDMKKKGRNVPGGTYGKDGYQRGENHHAAKLNETQVRAMRNDRLVGMSYNDISKKYGIAIGATYRICKGSAWKHVK